MKMENETEMDELGDGGMIKLVNKNILDFYVFVDLNSGVLRGYVSLYGIGNLSSGFTYISCLFLFLPLFLEEGEKVF
jgi:hypothetical protein